MSVKVIKTNVMKMQHVQIHMVIILVPAMMDSWVMVSAAQVYTLKFTYASKPTLFYHVIDKDFFPKCIFLIIIDHSFSD